MKFNNNYNCVGKVKGVYSFLEELDREIGIYSATPEFAYENSGPIVKSILDGIPKSYYQLAKENGLYPNIDVRIHRLYPGNYPAYPGWHCDAHFRETYFGQPKEEYTTVSNHLICTVSSNEGGISNTVFARESLELEIKPEENGIPNWAKVDNMVNEIGIKEIEMIDGDLTTFDSFTLHRASPAKVRGWRLFFRMALWCRPNLYQGKISKQEMIYLDMLKGSGW